MIDFGLVNDTIYGVYYIYLGGAAIGFDPYTPEIWGWVVDDTWGSYQEPEVKLLW